MSVQCSAGKNKQRLTTCITPVLIEPVSLVFRLDGGPERCLSADRLSPPAPPLPLEHEQSVKACVIDHRAIVCFLDARKTKPNQLIVHHEN